MTAQKGSAHRHHDALSSITQEISRRIDCCGDLNVKIFIPGQNLQQPEDLTAAKTQI